MRFDILTLADCALEQTIQDRRYIHQNPELSFQEYRTMEYICERLDAHQISYQKGIAGTGVLAEIQGCAPGRCLLIRADMDALAMEEQAKFPYRSKKQGVMHACGHDAHTAILLNTCTLLNSLKDQFRGTIKFAFQPGEETTGGAEPMIQAGILETPKVDACIALHVDSDLDCGSIRVKEGPMYASPDDFSITVKGRGGHGAEPHLAIDPILVAAQIICQLQTIVSRNLNPFDEAVITIGSIHAGNTTNVIPDSVELLGTARALTPKIRTLLSERIREVTKNICAAYGAEYEYSFIKLFPPLVNDPDIAKQLYESANRCLSKKECIWGGLPTMAGEDFAYFAEKVPSALFKLGCRNEFKGIVSPIHNPYFDIDEECLKYGIAIFVDFALNYLQ